jgi:penicillin G amidase
MPEFTMSAEGSNAWVVSGKHTESGKPLLVGDPHLDNTLPSHWYPLRATYK